jgi:hypothetical protein
MSFGWDEAVAFALTLPGVKMAAGAKGTTSPQVRGRQLISQGKAASTYVLRASREEILILRESQPEVFWQTPQYEGWPTVIVNGDLADAERMKILIERAWWDRASLKQRAEGGGERP